MGTLSIVATSIGNMKEITLRSIHTLKEADVIYIEQIAD
jgi:16S rRNA C1402 (ribose-2'-O) methylase RsmI